MHLADPFHKKNKTKQGTHLYIGVASTHALLFELQESSF